MENKVFPSQIPQDGSILFLRKENVSDPSTNIIHHHVCVNHRDVIRKRKSRKTHSTKSSAIIKRRTRSDIR